MNWYKKLVVAGSFGKITPRQFFEYFILPKFKERRISFQPPYEDFYEILEDDKNSLAQFIQLANSGDSPQKINHSLAKSLADRITQQLIFNHKFNPPANSIQDYRINKIINEEIAPTLKCDKNMFKKTIKTDAVLRDLYVKFIGRLVKEGKPDNALLGKMKDHWNSLPAETTQPKTIYDLNQNEIFEKYIKTQGDPFDKISMTAFVKMIRNGSQPLIEAYKAFAGSIKQFKDKNGHTTSLRANGKALHKLLNRMRKYLDAINTNKPKPLVTPNQGSGRGGGWNKFSGSEVIISDVLTMTIGKNAFVFQVDHKLWDNKGLYEESPVVDFLIDGKYHFELFGGPGMDSNKPISPGSSVTRQMIYDLKKQEKQKNIKNLFWLDNKADNLLKTYSLIKYAQALETHVDTNSVRNDSNSGKTEKVQLFKGLYDKLIAFKPLLSQFGIELSEHYVFAVMNASNQKKKLFEQQANQQRQTLDQQGYKVDIGGGKIGPKHPVNTELKNPYPMNQTQPLVNQLPKDIHNTSPKKTSQYNINEYRNNAQPMTQQNVGEPPTMEEIEQALMAQEFHSAHMWPDAEKVAVYFGTQEAITPYLNMFNSEQQNSNENETNNMKLQPDQSAPMGVAANKKWEWNLIK